MKLSLHELDNIFVALKLYTRSVPKPHKEEFENLTTKIYLFSNDEKKKLMINVEMEKDEQK